MMAKLLNTNQVAARAPRNGDSVRLLTFILLGVLGVSTGQPLHIARAAVSRQTNAPKITVVVPQAWLRTEPSLTAGNTVPVAQGQFYEVKARTADSAWWQLSVPDAPNAQSGTWLLASLGAPYAGDLNAAPAVNVGSTAQVKPAASATKSSRRKPNANGQKATPLPSWIPVITPRQRAIWQNSVKSGKDLNMFTVAGDCNSQPSVYLGRFAAGQFNASALEARLQTIVLRFSRSFGRISLAASGGFGAAMMMDPTWADGALCDVKNGQGPFACELWVSQASIVFIGLGTQEQYTWQDFEKNYRPMIELALAKGVLPILVTKADDIETASGAPSGYINDVVRKLAKEYDVPLLDYWAATRDLPNGGLIDEGDKDFHVSDAGLDRRMLITLQTLAAITDQ